VCQKYRCAKNIGVPKNICAKKYVCQKICVPKFAVPKKYVCQKYMCAKIRCAEIRVPKIYVPEFAVPKYVITLSLTDYLNSVIINVELKVIRERKLREHLEEATEIRMIKKIFLD
jgi:hypothetical protein